MRIPSGWAWLALATALSHGLAADESHVEFTFAIKGRVLNGSPTPTSIFSPDGIDRIVVDWLAKGVDVHKFTLNVVNTTSGETTSIGSGLVQKSQAETTEGQATASTTSTSVLRSLGPTGPTRCRGAASECTPTPGLVPRDDVVQLQVPVLLKQVQIMDPTSLFKFNGLPMYLEAFWGGNNSSFSRAFTVMPSTGTPPTWTSEYFVEDKAFRPDGFGPSVSPGATNPSGSSEASSGGGLAPGAIAGIAVGVVVILALIGGAIWFLIRRRRQAGDDDDTLDAYGTRRTRTDELMAEKEANAGVDASPHSPYSDDGGVQRDSSSLHNVAAGAGVAAVAIGAHHKSNLSESSQPAHDVPRSFTPYSDHRNSVARSPSTHAGSVVAASTVSPGGMESPTTSRATPHGGLATPYAHLVEEGMTADEIRRLEDEERALDAAIEQSAVRKP